MQKTDFIVVGSGLAGSLLALELLRSGQSVHVISNAALPTSSRVAGGLINPVTGKYLAKTWLAEELFKELVPYYKELERLLSACFYHPIGLYRPFSSEEHKKSSLAQIDKHGLQDFIQVIEEEPQTSEFFESSCGGMLSPQAGWVDLPLMLDLLEEHLKQNASWANEHFDFDLLSIQSDNIIYKEVEAKKIIFCEGFYVKDNPYFNWLPFNPVKGETLLGSIAGYTPECIVNQGKWLIPLGGDKVRLGATYSWHELDFIPTEKAREDLLATANKILRKEFKVEGQQAGVRPATKDRRPIVGFHPQFRSLVIFNGLGTKGVSLAPFFVKQLVRNVLYDEVINSEVNIERFYTLYSYK
jgi:glycine/D-amino acid oxidase-like deaminating enzyme